MDHAITPDDLPRWMAGRLVLDSSALGWRGITVKRYATPPQEVVVPKLTDFAFVAYARRAAVEWRREDGAWEAAAVRPGTVSVLTRAEVSHWRWRDSVDALHVYLPSDVLAATAAEIFGREVEALHLTNRLAADDPVLSAAAVRLGEEVRVGGLGGRLYVDALRCQMAVHVLRTHATVRLQDPPRRAGLSPAQRQTIVDYVRHNIAGDIALEDLAGLLTLSVHAFSRRFHDTFGCPPYAYVMRQRLEHAKRQLGRKDIPLKVVAADCGFSDQSHMTRLFRRTMNITPAQYRLQLHAARSPAGAE